MDYSLEQSVGFMLGLTHRKSAALLASQFKPYDITTEQFSVLFNVNRSEGVNQKEIAGLVFKDQPTTARIIDLLEKKGWVERRTSEHDRRAYLLYITKEGKALIDILVPIERAMNKKLAEGIPADQMEAFKHTLSLINHNL
ncbi:DNA-binding MarR family transcriptional regulator [Paenibacillus sp. JGP012]|uniref:Transcriptional regulator n=1 Tax=Paenibacillus silvae TaxID=1325358 RepID=A0A2W6NJ76_9BACL|nr:MULTISPECIES: MarR family transcriptional regulator [Paenibacillus]MBB6019260.1 DNA-binding MarR family transcriptional regulator [Paenibacillus sp. JGP012]MBU5350862.1 MarR family transcriptional regulator [Paenibacillus barcinonensis]MDM5278522.1 MarR family transcriptional regulator [Paenibacillus silvae]PZT55934.1 MarR family transcriptional regulator [Paenibacillus silvae]GGH59046.1 transcriptional regulator [Paenibacillus silvae]